MRYIMINNRRKIPGMRWRIADWGGRGAAVALLLIPLILFYPATLFGQAAHVISCGQPVGGGGSSSSGAYSLTGSVPLIGSIASGSPGHEIASGTILISSGLQPYSALEISYVGSSVMTVSYGTDRAVEVTVVSGTGADTTGILYTRPFGASSYTPRNMTLTQNILSHTLAGDLFDMRGMEYYIRITVGADVAMIGSSATPYIFNSSMNNEQGQRPTALPNASYRIIGLPINATSHSVLAVFDDDMGAYDNTQWRLAGYNASTETYEEHTDADLVYPGVGYWLIVRGGGTYGSAGTCVLPNVTYSGTNYYRVELDHGWNMLANPFAFNISWNDVMFDDNGTITGHGTDILDDEIHSYNGSSYTMLNGIRAWEGVFVYIKKSGVDALIRCRAVTTVSKTAPPVEKMNARDNWAVSLRLEVGGLADDYNLIGVRPDALVGEDYNDHFEPPSAPEGPRLAFKIDGANLKRTDYRPPFEDGAVWDIGLERAAGGTITFNGLDNIPDGMRAWLKLGRTMAALTEQDNNVTVPENVTAAQLIIGTEKYLSDNKNAALPERFALEQNVPNPFNPITNIGFTLPNPGHVKLEVFNILGQSITVLTDEELPAGYHTAVWEGTDNAGYSVASGIYFYRIEYGQYDQTRKMLLLK